MARLLLLARKIVGNLNTSIQKIIDFSDRSKVAKKNVFLLREEDKRKSLDLYMKKHPACEQTKKLYS